MLGRASIVVNKCGFFFVMQFSLFFFLSLYRSIYLCIYRFTNLSLTLFHQISPINTPNDYAL